MVKLEMSGHRVHKGCQVLLVKLEILEQGVCQEKMVMWDQLVHLDLEVMLGRMGHQVRRDHLGNQDLMDKGEHQDQLELEGSRDFQVWLDRLGSQVGMVRQEYRDLQDFQDLWDHEVREGSQERGAPWGHLGHMGSVGKWGHRDLMDLLGHRDQREQRGMQDQQD